MYNKINLMLPTYGRSKTKLPRFIDSAINMAHDVNNIRFVFCVNEKDFDTTDCINKMLGNKCEYFVVYEELATPHLAKYFNQMYDSIVKEYGQNEIVSMLGDDMEFKTKGWDLMILEAINNMDGYGMVYCNDGSWWQDRLCVNMFTTTKTVELLKPLPFMCELYSRDQIDVVWQKTMEALNMHYYLEGCKIEHHHSTRPDVQMDDVYTRLSKQDEQVKENIHLLDGYVEQCVKNVKENIVKTADYSINVMMTTYDRIPLLKETVYSYLNAIVVPNKLYVFDDCSNALEGVKRVFSDVPGLEFTTRNKNLGTAKSTPTALRWMFEENGSEVVVILDSDIQLDTFWYLKLCEMYKKLKNTENFGSINMLNLPNNPKGEPSKKYPGLLEKPHWGACGALITKKFWETYIVPNEHVKNGIWDNKSSHACSLAGKKNYVTTPSLIQHTGTMVGTNLGANSWAEDFRGKDMFNREKAIFEHGREGSVLFSIFGRYGDIIMCSMIKNMLTEKGYDVTWMTGPYYSDLLCHIDPKSTRMYEHMHLINRTAPWGDLPTEKLVEKFARIGFKYFINAQPGSRENHDILLGTGLHMAMFVKKRVEKILQVDLPNNFIDYINTDCVGSISIPNRDDSKPLCIIAPHVISIDPAISDRMLDELVEEYSVEYDVRILTKSRPDLPFSKIRGLYVYGLNFTSCINLLGHASLFIGNDSGLAWAAMFNRKCYKKIYHRVERLVQTNVWYNFIDPMAEDIIVE